MAPAISHSMKKKQVAYLVGELSSNIAVLDYDAKNGQLSLRNILSTIPDDWTEHNGAAAVRQSSDGKFVYVSNRGNNTIAVFSSDEKGDLKLIQRISTEGDFPRDFNLSDDESFVICLNQNSDNATLYARDAESGKLTMLQKDFAVPEGVSVLRKKSERSKAVRNWNLSRLNQKFLGLEFVVEVLKWKFLLYAAVLRKE